MSFNLVAIIISLLSLTGILLIVLRKIPVLFSLPKVLPVKGENRLLIKLKEKAKYHNPLKNFSYELFLQKLISKVRILTLKTENKTFKWLQHLKKKQQEKKLGEDNYWEEVKKPADDKNLPR